MIPATNRGAVIFAEEIVARLLERWPIARLALLDERSEPRQLPIVFARAEGALWSPVDGKAKRSAELARLDRLARHPRVSLLLDEYAADWSRLWWVSLRGWARVLEAGEEAERALRLLVDKYEQYRRELPGHPVLAVDILEWRSWDASATA